MHSDILAAGQSYLYVPSRLHRCLGVKESHAHILVTRSRANAPLRGNHIAHVIAHRMRTNQGAIPWHSAGSIPIYCPA